MADWAELVGVFRSVDLLDLIFANAGIQTTVHTSLTALSPMVMNKHWKPTTLWSNSIYVWY